MHDLTCGIDTSADRDGRDEGQHVVVAMKHAFDFDGGTAGRDGKLHLRGAGAREEAAEGQEHDDEARRADQTQGVEIDECGPRVVDCGGA